MSLDPAIFRALVGQGATPEMLLAVVEAAAAVDDARRERKRANNAERQARYRAKSNADNALQGVTARDERDPVSLDKESPQTPKKLIPSVCVNLSPRARDGYHRLPENWLPAKPLPATTQAKVDQWPPGTLADELAAFHRWAANASNEKGKGRKLDWDKAWVNWIERRHDERYRKSTTGTGHEYGSTIAAADSLIAELRGAEGRTGASFS